MRTATSPEQLRRDELLAALKQLRNGASPAQIVERLSRRLTSKLLHTPTKALA